MYDYISGKVAEKGINTAVIDAGGVGYLINTSAYSLERLKETGKLYTHLVVKEDEMALYGFYTREERSMFLKLIAISGVGPKMALSLLSSLKLGDLTLAIVSGDRAAFKKVPGIGDKTAQRIILELKEKLDAPAAFAPLPDDEGSVYAEAVAGLMALGYDKSEASLSVSKVRGLSDKTSELIFMALKRMGG